MLTFPQRNEYVNVKTNVGKIIYISIQKNFEEKGT